ncbi:MAG: peptidoglycan recognition protein family protein [Mycobacteriales bacterium]
MLGTVVIAALVSSPVPFDEAADHTPKQRSSDTPAGSQTLSLGSADAPARGAIAQLTQPAGVPLAQGVTSTDETPNRVLRSTGNTEKPFSAVGVSWTYRQASVTSVALRTKSDTDVPWSAWHSTTAEATGRTSERDGTGVIWTGPAVAVDVVVTSLERTAARDVRVGLIDPGRRAGDADTSGITTKASEKTSTQAGDSTLEVASRAQWGADEKLMTWTPEYAPEISAVVVHHTATTTEYTPEQVPAILRSIYRYQAVERGWGDIGYNIIVDKFGHAWEGRAGGIDKAVIGAHAQGFNAETSGIALIGNYVTAPPTEAALETLGRSIAYKLGRQDIKPTDTVRLTAGSGPRYPRGEVINVPAVIGHEAVGRTACPGVQLDAALPALRARAAALIGTVSGPTVTATG